MIKQLLFLCLSCSSLCFSQTTQTITIDWSFNSTPTASGNANTSRTIEVGDTVQWNWYANGTHNVVSTGGPETFASALTNNPGINFSYTFNQEGTTTYVCTPHSGNMFGSITVVADGTLNIDEFETISNIKLYPNPIKDKLFFDLPSGFNGKLNVEIFNVLGRKIHVFNTKNIPSGIDVSNINSGVYLLKIISEGNDSFVTKKIIKR